MEGCIQNVTKYSTANPKRYAPVIHYFNYNIYVFQPKTVRFVIGEFCQYKYVGNYSLKIPYELCS